MLSHPVELATYFSTSLKVILGKRERSTLGSLGKLKWNQTKRNLRFFAFCRRATRVQLSAILICRSLPWPKQEQNSFKNRMNESINKLIKKLSPAVPNALEVKVNTNARSQKLFRYIAYLTSG